MAKRVTGMKAGAALLALLAARPALAQPPGADSGDNAWLLAASALVLLALLPGLALSWAGVVRGRNLLPVFTQGFASVAAVSLLWAVAGYSLVFAPGPSMIGGLQNLGLANLAELRLGTAVSEPVFALFHMILAALAPTLMVGALVERVRLGWLVPFLLLWSLFVYVPVARWLWGGGWLAQLGTLDYAGGIVIHTTAGISALLLAILIGKRAYPAPVAPHSPVLRLAGAGLVWVGWFGLTGGSALGASADAGFALLNTHLAAAAAALCWMAAERIRHGGTGLAGFPTGALAGLAAVTPAAGLIGPMGAIGLGALAGILCFVMADLVRRRLDIDDASNMFAVHGVGGMLGALLVAPLTAVALGGVGYGDDSGVLVQLVAQIVGVAAVLLWTTVVTLLLALVVSLFLPMRVPAEMERGTPDPAAG
ncbi:ammonium transporter [Sphingobium lignivorans]|uniref:Amt family ammonium transporter n=1 Tax=Sphingobium lignivorans TaxID=2735886 RepID=A0ABR6NIU5_9SPHN|nr:ammonium transporter [Sphingobium lignivorans]MBB5987205.1 Amt family ammonium transporter [Sphingobium lignivorans]